MSVAQIAAGGIPGWLLLFMKSSNAFLRSIVGLVFIAFSVISVQASEFYWTDWTTEISPTHFQGTIATPSSTITVRSRPGWLTVSDEGPGVPFEHRNSAFERFWRAPGARGLPGSGLGLAIVADVVAVHGGSVRFVPRPRGASVRVDLPEIP